LANADVIVGHNVVGYDIPVLDKLFPGWRPTGGSGPLVLDTMLLSQLLWPVEQLRERDMTAFKKGAFPGKLIARYSLEAWGHRLKLHKGDYKGGWEKWSPEMQDYCEQDVIVTTALWKLCEERLRAWDIDPFDRNPPPRKDCAVVEHQMAEIISRQERRGVAFNTKKAEALLGILSARSLELQAALALEFPPQTVETVFIPKASNKNKGWVKGVPVSRFNTTRFNPSSRQQVAERLKSLGWEPEEFTPDGQPKVDDDILNSLPYPSAKLLAEYYTVEKRLAALGHGKQAWLKHVKNGRIHGRVTVNGAVTGRPTHFSPNMAQVPSVGQPYGKECRDLIEASIGYLLVGADADALELRGLAGFLAAYDGGAYIDTVLRLGCTRDVAKTWFYAFIYGAGDWKLGFTLTGQRGPKEKIVKIGSKGRAAFLKKLPAMKALQDAIARALKLRPYVVGLDGRRVSVRSSHAALNSVLQSMGAVIMKRAALILDQDLQRTHGLRAGSDYEFVLNIHDEWQIEARPEFAELIGKTACEAITKAGEFYSFACPLKGNYVVGRTWAETH